MVVEAAPDPSELRWSLRDTIAAGVLFAATAAVILWQNAHVAVLFDLSYILNTAERIAAGQVPYRDFPLAHAPLTFLLQAAIIRLTGCVYLHHVLYAAAVGGLSTVVTWRIALDTLRGRVAAWWVALLVAAPLCVVGIYCILPTPEYDCDCGFWILVAVWALQRVESAPHSSGKDNDVARVGRLLRGFVAGVALVAPLFFKQNMGLPLLLATIVAILFLLVARRFQAGTTRTRTPGPSALVAMLAGAGSAVLASTLLLHFSAGIRNYFHWTIAYAGRRRLPRLDAMAGVYRYPELAWMLPCVVIGLLLLCFGEIRSHPSDKNKGAARVGHPMWAQIAAFLLLAAPFLYALAALFVYYDDADSRGDSFLMIWPVVLALAAALATVKLVRSWREPSLRACLPLILLAAIHGTFLSQQLWGSTYGIWPLLLLLLAEWLEFLDGFALRAGASRRFMPVFAAFVSVAMLICGGFYVTSEERLSYAHLPDEPPAHSVFPKLAGLATPGPYLPEIDELLRYAQANIPFDDGIVLMPGEEPFYFATGRVPRFPVPFFDPTIDPYSPAEIAALVRSRNIRWLVVKTDVQTKEDPTPDRAATLELLMHEFTLAAHLRGYDVYRVGQRS